MANKRKQEARPFSPTLDRLKALQEPVKRNVNYDGVEPAEVYRLVASVNRAGGSVLIGATRDRGAWVVTVWHPQLGDKGRSEYCNSEEMLPAFITDLANMWEAVADELVGDESA